MKAKFLGEVELTSHEGTPYEKFSQTAWALLFLKGYGQCDGEHHKMWLIDQITRILLGTPIQLSLAKWSDGKQEYRYLTGQPSEAYQKWATLAKGDNFKYDTGIAP